MAKFAVISDLHLGQTGDDGLGQYPLLSRARTRSHPRRRFIYPFGERQTWADRRLTPRCGEEAEADG